MRFHASVRSIIEYFNIFPRSNSTDTTDQGMCTILLYNATTLDQVKVLYGGWRLKFMGDGG